MTTQYVPIRFVESVKGADAFVDPGEVGGLREGLKGIF
jgi:hypothetical protein